MSKQSLLILMLASWINLSLSAQDSASKADTLEASVASKRVNNTEPVDKIVIPNLEPRPLVLTQVTGSMSKGENPGIQMDIPEVSVDDIQRNLEKSIRNKTKSKFVKGDTETSIENTVISEIGDEPVNVFLKLTPIDSGARVVAFVEDKGKFISESEERDKYSRMTSFLRDFGLNAYREKVSDHIKSETKILNGLESDLNKLRKNNEKMHGDISKNESAITNAEADIKSNATGQEVMDEAVAKQKLVVSTATDKETKKAENKKLNSLEKEKDKSRSEASSLNKQIVKSRADIESLEADIKTNLQEQDLLEDKIAQQRAFVKGLEEKLGKIK